MAIQKVISLGGVSLRFMIILLEIIDGFLTIYTIAQKSYFILWYTPLSYIPQSVDLHLIHLGEISKESMNEPSDQKSDKNSLI
jgi:hypothetical protein